MNRKIIALFLVPMLFTLTSCEQNQKKHSDEKKIEKHNEAPNEAIQDDN